MQLEKKQNHTNIYHELNKKRNKDRYKLGKVENWGTLVTGELLSVDVDVGVDFMVNSNYENVCNHDA